MSKKSTAKLPSPSDRVAAPKSGLIDNKMFENFLDRHALDAEMQALLDANVNGNVPGPKAEVVEVVDPNTGRGLTGIATDVWRVRNKILDRESGEPLPEFKRISRHIESMLEALIALGIELDDPIDRRYDSGMAMKVLNFDPTPGTTEEVVKETIRPAILWKGKLIQMSEVIIATPVDD